jgi:kumamolisin
MLDIEVAGAVAPKAKIAVYFSTFTMKGWVDAITKAVHDTDNQPSVISVSWGFAEHERLHNPGTPPFIWSQSAVDAVNHALLAAASMGVTVTVAAGDDGSSDQFNDGSAHTDFPSSSPFVLSCGGTKLVGSGTTISSEVVWNELANGEGATGGGISDLNPRPSYQSDPPVPPSVNSGHHVGRGLPDVAGNADPVTGYQTLADGSPGVTGGTSAVAPLWAGLIALVNEGLGKNAGFFNPLLYLKIGPAGTLKDIQQGDNGAYKAKKGWDPCTGWGSPDGKALLDALK